MSGPFLKKQCLSDPPNYIHEPVEYLALLSESIVRLSE
jgi:hypothetical protein